MAERAAPGVTFRFEEDGKVLLPVVKKKAVVEAIE